ncbi:MAG TPA: hypothetical protein VHN99_09185 [Deinococcales bacterium]|nr:hypothetical protein [Deinococcales bacterium]
MDPPGLAVTRRVVQDLIGRELAADTAPGAGGLTTAAERAGEGVYALVLDHPELDLRDLLTALQELTGLEDARIVRAARWAADLLGGSGENVNLTRQRVEARREPNHPAALHLAAGNDLDGLRRLPARDLRLGLQAASPEAARLIAAAWTALPIYERERG